MLDFKQTNERFSNPNLLLPALEGLILNWACILIFSWSILVIINRFWNTNQISQVTNKDCLTNHASLRDNVSFKFPHRHHHRCRLLFGKDANVIMCRFLSFNTQTVASSTTGANMNYHFIWKYLCSSCWWTNNPYIHGFAFFSQVVKVHALQLWRYLFIA